MKDLIVSSLFLLIFLLSCRRDPEFFINGIPYYTESRCIKDTTYYENTHHYVFSSFGKLVLIYGPEEKHECLNYCIDTIEIKDYEGTKNY